MDGEDQCQTCYIKLLERLLAEQKAKPQPVEATEFTKQVAESWRTCVVYGNDFWLGDKLREACNIIKGLTAENKALAERIEKLENFLQPDIKYALKGSD
jgi:hypothetical protein